MRRVVWTQGARRNLERIRDYVSAYRPIAAQRLAQRLFEAGDSLIDAPERGRAISHGRRELAVIAPYLIRYRLEGEAVVIVEVRHGARRS